MNKTIVKRYYDYACITMSKVSRSKTMDELTITIRAALLGFLTSSLIMFLFFNGDIKTVAYCGLGSCIYVIIRMIMISRD